MLWCKKEYERLSKNHFAVPCREASPLLACGVQHPTPAARIKEDHVSQGVDKTLNIRTQCLKNDGTFGAIPISLLLNGFPIQPASVLTDMGIKALKSH